MPDEQRVGTAGSARRSISVGWILLIWLSLTGMACYAFFDKSVFPSASINLKLSKSDAKEKSRSFAQKIGYDTNQSFDSTTFTYDEDAKTMLEFKLGLARANELMKSEIPVWLWRTRFCKPLSHEELAVWWTAGGELEAFDHTIDNDKAIPSVSIDDAEQMASQFVLKSAGQDLSKYTLFDRGSETKSHRSDFHFIWKKPSYAGSELRVVVQVAGNQVSAYRYFLSPNDTWTREYKGIRETNDLLGMIASVFIFLLLAVAIGAFVTALARHEVRWKATLYASLLVATLVVANQLNNFAYAFDRYNPSKEYSVFLLETIGMDLFFGFAAFVLSVMLVGGAEYVYRLNWKKQVAGEYLFTLKGLSLPALRKSLYLGYLIPGVMMLWEILYYTVGQKLNYFCPLGIDDYKVLGTFCPAIDGILTGVSASGMEELLCRVVGLALFNKLFRNFWLANLAQAIIWGFAHSSYPQEPAYARGIELTAVGLCLGWVVHRFGILPCLIAHYLYDAFLSVEPVFSSQDPILIVPSILMLLPFLLMAWVGADWARKNKVPMEPARLANEAMVAVPRVKPVEESEDVHWSLRYESLSSKKVVVLSLVAIISFILALSIQLEKIGMDKQVTVNAVEAKALAGKALQEDHLDAIGYMAVPELVMKPDTKEIPTWQYLFEKVGLAKTISIYNETMPAVDWRVRFFREHTARSYTVYLDGHGKKRACSIEDLEDAAGAKLTADQARNLVEKYVALNRPEVLPIKFDSVHITKRANRIDYKFDFLAPKFNATGAVCKVHADVIADKVTDVILTWDIPDEWSFERSKQTIHEKVNSASCIVVAIVFTVILLIWVIHVIRTAGVPWRLAFWTSGIVICLSIIQSMNNIGSLLLNYNTAESFNSFLGTGVALQGISILVLGTSKSLLCIAGLACVNYSFPSLLQQLTAFTEAASRSAEERANRLLLFRDGCVGSYALLGIFIVLPLLKQYLVLLYSPVVPIDMPALLHSVFSATIPFVELTASILINSIVALMFLAVLASFSNKYLNTWQRMLPCILVLSLLAGTSAKFLRQCEIDIIFYILTSLALWLFTKHVLKLNCLSYLFLAFEFAAARYLSELIAHAATIALPEICLSITLIFLPLLAYLLVLWKSKKAVNEPRLTV